MQLKIALQNAFKSYANRTAIEIENTSYTYAEIQTQSQRIARFLASKNGGGGAE
ncbi:hypothetical protein [Helicobacter sp.]|uniref:hypothetical protein n=1 Tax=Helicobacter sp. TaxID=218 RepID=UPI0019B9468F|nr:hypothetical protein [Helicobacter sp.]MBD5164692.1 hypothetical protein [Helicobacter sp.]